MADALEWTEELVAEYFELRGFVVIRDLPSTTAPRGGRSDADVVAFKRQEPRRAGRTLKVVDAEVGTAYLSAEAIAGKLEKKFSKARQRMILSTVSKATGQSANRMCYRKFYFDFGWLSEGGVLAELRDRLGGRVKVVGTKQLINASARAIDDWKRDNPTPKGGEPSLPERFPSLQVVLACRYSWVRNEIAGELID